MHLNPPMVKKTPKEVGNRKTKTTKNMGMKNNGFIHPFVSKRLSLGSPPMDLLPGLKKMLLYKIEQVGIGTLTRLPPMDHRFISPTSPAFLFTADFFGAMGMREHGFSLASRSGASGG